MLYRLNGGAPQRLPNPYYVEGLPYTNLSGDPALLAELGWVEDPDAVEPPPVGADPRRIPKVDFWRRFQPAEQVAMLGARKFINAMTPADFALIENVGWWTLAVVFQEIDMIPEFVELDYPGTRAGLEAFAAAGLISEEHIAIVLA